MSQEIFAALTSVRQATMLTVSRTRRYKSAADVNSSVSTFPSGTCAPARTATSWLATSPAMVSLKGLLCSGVNFTYVYDNTHLKLGYFVAKYIFSVYVKHFDFLDQSSVDFINILHAAF